jgi:hypothetical protein
MKLLAYIQDVYGVYFSSHFLEARKVEFPKEKLTSAQELDEFTRYMPFVSSSTRGKLCSPNEEDFRGYPG